MAVHLEIKDIEGDSIADTYEKQIDCASWAWSAYNSSDASRATGMAQATSTIDNVTVASYMGTASVNLMVAAMTGKHLGEVKLHCTKSDGTSTMEWLTVTMTDAILTTCSQSGSDQDMGVDNIALSFKKVQMQYFSQDNKGKQVNGPDHTFNVATGKLEK